jgi:hypothetical protein
MLLVIVTKESKKESSKSEMRRNKRDKIHARKVKLNVRTREKESVKRGSIE